MNGMGEMDHDYEAGLRDGRIKSLEETVEKLSRDVGMLNKAVWLLYGAIAIIQFFFPVLERVAINGSITP